MVSFVNGKTENERLKKVLRFKNNREFTNGLIATAMIQYYQESLLVEEQDTKTVEFIAFKVGVPPSRQPETEAAQVAFALMSDLIDKNGVLSREIT